MPEKKHLILCGDVPREVPDGQNRRELCLGKEADQINLDIEALNKKVVQELPPLLRDLLDIATYVYVGDQIIARGGQKSFDYGGRWHRRMTFRIAVRDNRTWADPGITDLLEETLSVASGNTFRFEFHPLLQDRFSEYLNFPNGESTNTGYNEVLLFSGGLDSFTGAMDEVVSKGSRPILVSHQSHNRMKKLQRDLFAYVHGVSQYGKRPLHVPVLVNKDKELTCETSQRTRSFLYAALGTVVARIFKLKRIRFYENGVVSCNLQWDNQTLQARATRSTHPRVLNLLSQLISEVAGVEFVVQNPYFEKTRTEVCERLKILHQETRIGQTRSCACSIHRNPETHCGICSQCLDRRFATIAAQCAEYDPDWRYALKVFQDPLSKPRERQMGLGFVGFAGRMEGLTLEGFVQRYSSELHEIAGYMTTQGEKAYKELYDLHRRHAEQVNRVLDAKLSENISKIRSGRLHVDCLLRAVARGEHLGEGRPSKAVDKGKTPSKRQDTGNGRQSKAAQEQVLLHAALMQHHHINDSEINWEPATQKELQGLTKWKQSKVSRMMETLFGKKPMQVYRSHCKERTIRGFLLKRDDGSRDVEAYAPSDDE